MPRTCSVNLGSGVMQTTDETVWELTVDFVGVGAGAAGLAAAIAAVDAGATVFLANFGRALDPSDVAGPPAPTPRSLGRTLGAELADEDTAGYLAALTEEHPESTAPPCGDDVPVLTVRDLTPVIAKQPGRRDPVPPFHGGRLGDWAAECLGAPLGLVYSRVIADATTPKRSRAGATVEIASIGTIELDPDASAPTLYEWMSAAAGERDIDVPDRIVLQRLVFEEGQVVGAVFDTPTASLAVRARHGVMLACDAEPAGAPTSMAALVDEPTTAEICLAREPLSRFSRVELHVRAASVNARVGVPSGR